LSKQDPIVDLAKLHFLVDLCGGGMAEFGYRNATQLTEKAKQSSRVHGFVSPEISMQ
jgi:hypothetical protein